MEKLTLLDLRGGVWMQSNHQLFHRVRFEV